jgi:hypothetical protein
MTAAPTDALKIKRPFSDSANSENVPSSSSEVQSTAAPSHSLIVGRIDKMVEVHSDIEELFFEHSYISSSQKFVFKRGKDAKGKKKRD